MTTLHITPNRVHLWFARDGEIRDPGLLARYQCLLSEPERIQQQRFVFEKDRHQYLVTRALVRTVLSRYLIETPPAALEFGKNAHNKPHLANSQAPMDLAFNISHTRGLIVVAVTSGDAVGVDVEAVSRRDNTLDIAREYFSAREVSEIMASAAGEQHRRFFDVWTLKEAYIKARGMGLSIPLHQFSYRFPTRDRIHVTFDSALEDNPRHWNFWQIKPSEDHIAALALHRRRGGTMPRLEMRKIVPLVASERVHFPVIAQSGQYQPAPDY